MKTINSAVEKEIFDINQYQKFLQVENNDLVLDLGCSQGPFYFQNKHKNIKYVGVDASIDCIKDFYSNLKEEGAKNDFIFIINSFLNKDLLVNSFNWDMVSLEKKQVSSITFPCLMNFLGRKVDFLKFDIEGYEKLFLIDNYDFFKKSVYKFAGEIHFNAYMHRQEAYDMLDKMRQDNDIKFKLHSIDGVDISDYYWSDRDYYTEIIINGFVSN